MDNKTEGYSTGKQNTRERVEKVRGKRARWKRGSLSTSKIVETPIKPNPAMGRPERRRG